MPFAQTMYGSSPRKRGTGDGQPFGAERTRFIPAQAGNSTACTDLARPYAVHPRASGEQAAGVEGVAIDLGSSPRKRGTDKP